MNSTTITEKEAMDILIARAKVEGVPTPRALIINRQVMKDPQRSLTRTVRIALIVSINEEALLDALISECVDNNNDIYFVGSDVNLQSDMSIDYLFFETKVIAKCKETN